MRYKTSQQTSWLSLMFARCQKLIAAYAVARPLDATAASVSASQAAFAESEDSVSAAEPGRRLLDKDTYNRICRILNHNMKRSCIAADKSQLQ